VEYRGKRRPTGVGIVTPGIAAWARGFAPQQFGLTPREFASMWSMRRPTGIMLQTSVADAGYAPAKNLNRKYVRRRQIRS
jgi:hypothetical protein